MYASPCKGAPAAYSGSPRIPVCRYGFISLPFCQAQTNHWSAFCPMEHKDIIEQGLATKDFVRAEIKGLESHMIRWFIGTAIGLTIAVAAITNLIR